jgi:hypothetical protein
MELPCLAGGTALRSLQSGVNDELMQHPVFSSVSEASLRSTGKFAFIGRVPRSLRFLQGAGADGDDTSWFHKRNFMAEEFMVPECSTGAPGGWVPALLQFGFH